MLAERHVFELTGKRISRVVAPVIVTIFAKLLLCVLMALPEEFQHEPEKKA
jgi:hypothetical protein